MCVLIFSTTFVSNISHCKNCLHVKYLLFLTDFNETLFSRKIFKKYPSIKFHESPSSGGPVVPREQRDRQTDRHDEANSHFLQFCKRDYIWIANDLNTTLDEVDGGN